MAYDFHYTPTGTGVISGKEVLEQTEDAINDLSGQISGDVQIAIDTANNALNTANTASVDAQNAINTANTAYTAATNAQNTANTAQNTASNALTAAQNAQNDVNALGNRVTTAENNISQNTSDISGLTTRMGTAEGNIGNLQTAVSNAQATANSAQQTATTARQQSYVLRYSSTTLVASSTNSNSLLDNTDNLKVGDKVIDASGVIYSVTAIDTANSTFTIGTALIDLAQDSDVVHKSGNETIGGQKTFIEYITSDGATTGDEYSNNAKTNLWLMSNRDTEGVSGVLFDTFRQNTTQGTGLHILGFGIKENSVRYEGCRFSWSWDNNLNGYYLDFKPTKQGTYQAVRHNLGTSTDKWDTINGLNPGSLSFPDLSNGVDISAYITDLTGASNTNKYTPTVNGWVSIGLSNADFIEIYIPSLLMGGTFTKSSNGYAQAFMPVIANKVVRFALKGDTIGWAKFYPNLGNV